jgi:hypothetical protein
MAIRATRLCWLFCLVLSIQVRSYAGDKLVKLDTTPEGASVKINGSITCTTPCFIKVPDYYFGSKHTVFSKHGIEPITARLQKMGLYGERFRLPLARFLDEPQWRTCI